MATAASIAGGFPSTQGSRPSRKDLLASIRPRVAKKVESLRCLLANLAPRGLASDVAAAMDWRIERRSREVVGRSEKLSIEDFLAEIEIHAIDGRQDAVDDLVAAMLEGLHTACFPVTPTTVIRLFDKNGQRFLRFEL